MTNSRIHDSKKCVHGNIGGQCSDCAFLIKRIDAHNRNFPDWGEDTDTATLPPLFKKKQHKCPHGRDVKWCTTCRYRGYYAL